MPVQVALVRKATQEGDLGYGQGSASEKLFGPLDATLYDVLVRSKPRRFLEQTREVVRAHVRGTRHLGQRQVFLEVVSYIVDRSFERSLGETTGRLCCGLPDGFSPQGRVVPNKRDRQSVCQGLGVELAAENLLGFDFSLERERDPLDLGSGTRRRFTISIPSGSASTLCATSRKRASSRHKGSRSLSVVPLNAHSQGGPAGMIATSP